MTTRYSVYRRDPAYCVSEWPTFEEAVIHLVSSTAHCCVREATYDREQRKWNITFRDDPIPMEEYMKTFDNFIIREKLTAAGLDSADSKAKDYFLSHPRVSESIPVQDWDKTARILEEEKKIPYPPRHVVWRLRRERFPMGPYRWFYPNWERQGRKPAVNSNILLDHDPSCIAGEANWRAVDQRQMLGITEGKEALASNPEGIDLLEDNTLACVRPNVDYASLLPPNLPCKCATKEYDIYGTMCFCSIPPSAPDTPKVQMRTDIFGCEISS